MFIRRYIFGFRVFLTHHRFDRLARAFPGINQNEVLSALNIFMKLLQFLVLDTDTKHATHPGTEQGSDEHNRKICENTCVRPKCLRGHEQKCAKHADEKADIGTKKPRTREIQRFNVVAA